MPYRKCYFRFSLLRIVLNVLNKPFFKIMNIYAKDALFSVSSKTTHSAVFLSGNQHIFEVQNCKHQAFESPVHE